MAFGSEHTSRVVALGDWAGTVLLPRVKLPWQHVQGASLLRREEFSRDPVQSDLIVSSEDQGSLYRHGYLLFELQTLVNDEAL